jgi:hypothetical protein
VFVCVFVCVCVCARAQHLLLFSATVLFSVSFPFYSTLSYSNTPQQIMISICTIEYSSEYYLLITTAAATKTWSHSHYCAEIFSRHSPAGYYGRAVRPNNRLLSDAHKRPTRALLCEHELHRLARSTTYRYRQPRAAAGRARD